MSFSIKNSWKPLKYVDFLETKQKKADKYDFTTSDSRFQALQPFLNATEAD